MVTNSVKGQRSNKQYCVFVHFALRVIFEILNPFKALTQRITRSILKIISEIGAGSLFQVLPSSIHDAMATVGYWPPGSEVMGFLQPVSWFYRFSIWGQSKQEKNNTNGEEMWSACSCGQRKVASVTSISSSKCCSWAFIILYILCRTAQNHGSSLLNHNLGSKPPGKSLPSPIHQCPRGNAAFSALYQMESWLFSCFCRPQWSLCMLAGTVFKPLLQSWYTKYGKENQTKEREIGNLKMM